MIPALAYVVIAALVALDAVFPVVPSEFAVVAAGSVAAAGDLSIVGAVLAAALGALAGNHVVYWLGRRQLTDAFSRTRMGRRVVRAALSAHDRLGSSSGAAIAAARFVPFGRTAGAGAAGLGGVRPRQFLTFSAIGSLAWAAWMVGIGFVTGSVNDGPVWTNVLLGMAVALVIGVWLATARAMTRTRRRISERATINPRSDAPGSRQQSAPELRRRIPETSLAR